MNAQLLHVVSESFPASRKVYRSGRLHAGLKVPMRLRGGITRLQRCGRPSP
jgi:hypothetical protein